MNYFEIGDKEIKGAYIIYPFSKVASVYKHFQDKKEPEIMVLMDNKDRFNINESAYHNYMEWLMK